MASQTHLPTQGTLPQRGLPIWYPIPKQQHRAPLVRVCLCSHSCRALQDHRSDRSLLAVEPEPRVRAPATVRPSRATKLVVMAGHLHSDT